MTGTRSSTPSTIWTCVRAVPLSLYTGTLVKSGIHTIGLIDQIWKPRTSFSPPMKERLNGGGTRPPKPLRNENRARIAIVRRPPCGRKYLASTVGWMKRVLPPGPAIAKLAYRLLPFDGVIGWSTVL